MQSPISLLMPQCMLLQAPPPCACNIPGVGKSVWHLSLRMMASLPGCPARHVASPDMSERQCSGDVLLALHNTLASALTDSVPCVQTARVYSPACNRKYHLESFEREAVKTMQPGLDEEYCQTSQLHGVAAQL